MISVPNVAQRLLGEIMKCSNCNIEIPNDSAFCQHCGSKVILKEKHDDQLEQTKIKKSNIVLVAIIVFLLASVVMNVVQIVNNHKITSKLSKSDKIMTTGRAGSMHCPLRA